MPANFLDRIDDHEAAIASIGSLASREDVVLVAAAKDGSSRACEALVERHARRILRVAQRVTENREDAEDIVQQSFQKAFAHLREFEGRSSFATWLTRIAINEGLMLRRKIRGLREVSIDDSDANEETTGPREILDLSPSPERSYSQQERERILSLAMNHLTPGIRAAIELSALDERSLKESAQMMGVSVAAAKSRVLRGRRKLRETLKRYVAPTRMFGSDRLQINPDTNGNAHSPAARAGRAKMN
jgi:RNA polymerase sigma-70 factor, ECF subfamily